MVDCFFCGKKIGWRDTHANIQTIVNDGDNIPGGMTDKDKVCEDCVVAGKTHNILPNNDDDRQVSMDPGINPLNSQTDSSNVSQAETLPVQTASKAISKVTTIDELRTLTQTLHNQFKAKWDKNGIVQFKNNEIVILKRIWGQQVQFIVAYSQVTKEGYRLMAIDEGMEAQGSGFSGGASAYFYFQKMDFVK